MNRLTVLVLAAGQGTRMKSDLPKVLHSLAERPLLEHVLVMLRALRPSRLGVVLGHGRAQVQSALRERGWSRFATIVQPVARGSGDAVRHAASWLRRQPGTLLVVYGDTPLLTAATLSRLIKTHDASGDAATFLAMEAVDPTGYGRIIQAGDGSVVRIVEHRDASDEQRRIRLVNSGVACWDIRRLLAVLPKLKADNARKEYYLTDAAAILRAQGHRVGVVTAADEAETHGINDRVDLAEAEAILRRRILNDWMRRGVTIIDPASTWIDARAKLAGDTRLWPGTIIRGESVIGRDCEIGPYTVVEGARIGDGVRVGPFARLRPGTVLEAQSRVGNFVEIKKTRVGRGSKVNHLTYLGDARLGSQVNVGAGTITCNYDGFRKSATAIGDGAFIGSNANLVAPVRLGRGVIVAAGSTVTRNVPADSLVVARSRQDVKSGWARTFRRRQKRTRHD